MDYKEDKVWQVGQTTYRLDRELFASSQNIIVRRSITAFDKAITDARARRAAVEFSGNITIELTENLIGLRGTGVKTLEGATQALDEFMSTLDRIVTGREAGVMAQDPRYTHAFRDTSARLRYRNNPLALRARRH